MFSKKLNICLFGCSINSSTRTSCIYGILLMLLFAISLVSCASTDTQEAPPKAEDSGNYIKNKNGQKFEIFQSPLREYKVRNEPHLGFVMRTAERENGISITWHTFSNKKAGAQSLPASAILMPTEMEIIKVKNIDIDTNEYTAKHLELNPYTNNFMFNSPGAEIEFVGNRDIPFMDWYYKPGGKVQINENGEAVPTKDTIRYKK